MPSSPGFANHSTVASTLVHSSSLSELSVRTIARILKSFWEFSKDGSYDQIPDFIIMIYGETPYAEGEGDIESLDFSSSNLC